MDKQVINNYLSILFDNDFNVKAYKKGFISLENKKQDLKLCFMDNECSFYNFDYENITIFNITFSKINKILKSNKMLAFKVRILKGRQKKEKHFKLKATLKFFLKRLMKNKLVLKQKYIAYVDNYNINIYTNVLQYKYNNDIYSIFMHKSKNTIYLFVCCGIDKNLKIMYRLNISRFLYLKSVQNLIKLLDFKAA